MRAAIATQEFDQTALKFGIGLTLFVHAILAAVMVLATGVPDVEAIRFPVMRRLCGDLRCAEKPVLFRRRPLDPFVEDVGLIEAAIIPRLGYAEPNTAELPKLVKYEQPEKIEEAVNISKEPVEKKDVPVMDVQAKKAELDKLKKRRTLASILGAPEDDDPRKRPTALERIVGSPQGSVFGGGLESVHGNVYAGKVALAIRQHFTVPPFISEAELKKLRMRIRVTKMSAAGQIIEFEVVRESGNSAFDGAALRAIQKFVPKAGGNAYLPAPDATTLDLINSRGMVVDLDGALFR